MYGAEPWALKKVQENKLDVAKMIVVRWMFGGLYEARQVKRNERIRGNESGE